MCRHQIRFDAEYHTHLILLTGYTISNTKTALQTLIEPGLRVWGWKHELLRHWRKPQHSILMKLRFFFLFRPLTRCLSLPHSFRGKWNRISKWERERCLRQLHVYNPQSLCPAKIHTLHVWLLKSMHVYVFEGVSVLHPCITECPWGVKQRWSLKRYPQRECCPMWLHSVLSVSVTVYGFAPPWRLPGHILACWSHQQSGSTWTLNKEMLR